MSTQQRVFDTLRSIQQTPGLDAIKRLFWTELNYDRANDPISTRDWPTTATENLAEAPARPTSSAPGSPSSFMWATSSTRAAGPGCAR